jgi:hypothetical protein
MEIVACAKLDMLAKFSETAKLNSVVFVCLSVAVRDFERVGWIVPDRGGHR